MQFPISVFIYDCKKIAFNGNITPTKGWCNKETLLPKESVVYGAWEINVETNGY